VAYTPLLEVRIGVPDPEITATADTGAVMGLGGFEWGRRQFS
jgi:hypothetical protein